MDNIYVPLLTAELLGALLTHLNRQLAVIPPFAPVVAVIVNNTKSLATPKTHSLLRQTLWTFYQSR